MPPLDHAVPTDPEFVITRVFAAPRQRLWEAWTNPDLYARWFGPRGSSARILTADIRPGGLLHSRIETPEGMVMYARCVYREVIEPSRLVWVQSFSDERAAIVRAPFFDGRWPREMWTGLLFEDDGAGTRLTLTWKPLDAEADERANFISNIPSMRGGWGGSFDQLDAVLAATA